MPADVPLSRSERAKSVPALGAMYLLSKSWTWKSDAEAAESEGEEGE